MFSTCIFCNKPLGRNESIETFPVGERLAFDPARGRLWVVCRSCERWNLSPLEERWEAIEEAEKLYRDTRRRVSTDNIRLAKLASGRRSCASASRSVPSSPRGGTAISSAAVAIARSSRPAVGSPPWPPSWPVEPPQAWRSGSFGFLYVQVGRSPHLWRRRNRGGSCSHGASWRRRRAAPPPGRVIDRHHR
ncbi:MAG: hypothetical protein IPJ56_09245 [Gemmatimonadetes bacterium]|nr:hypothetical protein [Gemmatimonadota bacterium]